MIENREIDRINKPKKKDREVILQGEKHLESWKKPIKINGKSSKVRKV